MVTKSEKFSNRVFGLMAALLLLLLIYFGYKEVQGIPTSMTIYGAVGVLLVLLLAGLKFLPRSIKVNLTLLIITSLIIVYALEAFLHFYGNPLDYRTPNFVAARTLRMPFDKRTPLQVVDQIRKGGNEAFPFVAPNLFIGEMPETETGETIYVLGGISNVKTVHCNELGTYLIYESDRFGFHNNDAIWEEPTLEVVALGDSFTQGACVQPHENYVSRIRDVVPQTLNLGASGNGPLSALATLKEYAAARKPKHVLWFYYEGNDMGDLMAEVTNPTLISYMEDGFTQNLVARQDDVNFVRGVYVQAVMAGLTGVAWRERLDALRLYNVRRLLRLTREPIFEENPAADRLGPQKGEGQDAVTQGSIEQKADATSAKAHPSDANAAGSTASSPSPVQADSPACTGIFTDRSETPTLEVDVPLEYDRTVYDPVMEFGVSNLMHVADYMEDIVESWGGELTVVYLPDYIRFYPQNPARVEANYRFCALEAFARAEVDVLDMLPVFEEQPESLTLFPFGLYGHYSPQGNALVAETVRQYLEAKQR